MKDFKAGMLSQDHVDALLGRTFDEPENTTDIKGLVMSHWEYNRGILDVCMPSEMYCKTELIRMIGYFYQQAMIHGWKHRDELCCNGGGIVAKEPEKYHFSFNFDNPLFRKLVEEEENKNT